MERWRAIEGPTRVAVGPHDDLTVWSVTVERRGVPAQVQTIRIEFMGSLLRSDRGLLNTEVREALETNGQSAVERFLDRDEPPARIVVSATAIRPLRE